MKLFRLSAAVLVTLSLLFTACKGKAPKDLIVNKWKLTEVTGEGAKEMGEEGIKKMTDKVVMELSKDGKCTISGAGEQPQTGTYTISDDGKTLNLTHDGETKADPQMISELTASKLVIVDDKSKMKLVFAAK